MSNTKKTKRIFGFDVYMKKRGWQWMFTAKNGQIFCDNRVYYTRAGNAARAIKSMRAALGATVDTPVRIHR